MAVTYGFYNALNHDRVYDALQMSSIFDGIIQNGVFSTIGEALICKASGTGLIVNVGSGRAWFDHTWTLNDTDYPVEAEQAEVVLDRIDAIVLEVNQAVEVRANSIKFVKGTPSSTPVRPTMIHNAEVNQYALAYVSVRAGQTTIFDSDITNVVGTDETPFVTGLLQQLSVEQLLIQWNDDFYRYFNNFKTVSTADFNSFMTTKQTEYAAWYANMQAEGAADLAEFDAWFQHMKDQLDEDAAGHLQAEIDALALQAEKGSIIRVTTPESTLINQTCTITQDLLSRTATFDSHGVADFPSVPMTGDMVITSTDGTMTAIRNVNIPYFGRYEFEIAFWSATLAIHTSSSDLYGRPITIKQGATTIGTTTFNQQGVASFDVHSAGTYTVSAVTTGGTESTADVVVTEETTYNVELGSTPEGATVTPTDVISTWIACAGLNNTHNYTTITEVMADTELFDTLLRDSNACDYMARSTTWATDITSDRDAMTRVGLYDYCSEKLLSNATWAEAIAESDYFEEVLDTKVPTMTSNTTPSGICSTACDNSYSGLDYNNFDGNTTLGTYTQNGTYIAPTYEFPNKVLIKRASFNNTTNINVLYQNYKVQASDDKTTWVDLTSTIPISDAGAGAKIDIDLSDNNIAYKAYRILYSGKYGSKLYIGACRIQFYGRHPSDQSVTQIHSCPNDTIYHMANGSPVVLATTDANGVGEVDWGELPAGDLTLYSSVAKDPDNLSNDYHKVCTITKTTYGHTTDFYLMPDHTLYWYGMEKYDHHVEKGSNANNSITFNTNNIVLYGYVIDASHYQFADVSFNKKITRSSKICLFILDTTARSKRCGVSASYPHTYNNFTDVIGDYSTGYNEGILSSEGYPVIEAGGGTTTVGGIWFE